MDRGGNLRGAFLMTVSMTSFTINDVFMKLLSEDLPLAQSILLRGLGATTLLLVLARVTGQLRLRLPRRDAGLLVIRTLSEVVIIYFFLTALFNMPIANATAILQSVPLAVTLAAAVFLGEPLGWRRLTAILVGFVGVLLIVRPGTEGFNIYALYVLVAVALIVLRDLAVRRMSVALPTLTVAFIASAGVTLCYGGAALAQPWVPVSPRSALLLGGAVVCVLVAYTTSIGAMRHGALAVVSPFRYTSLVAAVIVGYVVFDDWPAPLTFVGAVLVMATGVFTLWREQKLLRDAPVSRQASGRVDTPPDSL